MNSKTTLEIYRRAIADLRETEKRLEATLAKAQSLCCHPAEYVVEGDYVPDVYGHRPLPPFAVCLLCGYNEPGWGSWYRKLSPSNTIPRKEAMRYVAPRLNSRDEC